MSTATADVDTAPIPVPPATLRLGIGPNDGQRVAVPTRGGTLVIVDAPGVPAGEVRIVSHDREIARVYPVG